MIADVDATVWIRAGFAAYLGPSLRLDPHSGSVQCFALGIDVPFLLRTADGDERKVRSAFIPARTRHQVVSDAGRMLFFYADPTLARDGDFRRHMTESVASLDATHRDESALIDYVRQANPLDPGTLLPRIVGKSEPTATDPRIVLAVRAIRADPAGNLGASELAAAANLSTSRFLHLFSAHTGTSFRRYRLWVRMAHVAVSLSAGRDFTTAAAEAGFASPSHFSDVFHTMFGLTASNLLASGTRILIGR